MLQRDKFKTKRSQNFKIRKPRKTNHINRFKRIFGVKQIHYISITKEAIIHIQHLIKLRRPIKKIKKKIEFSGIRPKIWIIFSFNKILSKKGKNSRMGKGRGNFCSWLIRLNKFSVLLKLLDINSNLVYAIATKLKSITNIKFISF